MLLLDHKLIYAKMAKISEHKYYYNVIRKKKVLALVFLDGAEK